VVTREAEAEEAEEGEVVVEEEVEEVALLLQWEKNTLPASQCTPDDSGWALVVEHTGFHIVHTVVHTGFHVVHTMVRKDWVHSQALRIRTGLAEVQMDW
jgi:hypothetical protein